MKLTLKTNQNAKMLVISIPMGLSYVLYWFYIEQPPISDPLIFWLSFFLLWFMLGSLGFMLADDNGLYVGILAVLFGVLLLGSIATSHFFSPMLMVAYAHAGFPAGVVAAQATYFIMRVINPAKYKPEMEQHITNYEKDLLKVVGVLYVTIIYGVTAYYLKLLPNFYSLWYGIGVLLVLLSCASVGWMLNKYRR